jgi:hypothetical protein
MHRVILFCVLLMPGTSSMAAIVDSQAFINEFHYDNTGGDRLEFVEVLYPEAWPDKELLNLTLYNGSTGKVYGGPYAYDRFTLGEVVNGYRVLVLDVALQNGSPDGFALAQGTSVLQLLSYEGTFTAEDGVAAGLLSTDVGVLEDPNTPLDTSLQLAGAGDSYGDFAWQAGLPQTRGRINQGQTVGSSSNAVPEPRSAYTWLVLGLLAMGAGGIFRSRRVAVEGIADAPR